MLYVFFPVYNEGSSAGALVRRCGEECRKLGRDFRIVAVDDGSDDDSVSGMLEAGETNLVILRHERNQGLRKALETGISWLVRHADPDDQVAFMDGDDSHDPSQLAAMLALVEDGADVVIASRFRRGAEIHGLSALRKTLSAGAAVFGSLAFRVPGVRDYSCGYRMTRGSALIGTAKRYGNRLFELDGSSFICSVELLIKLSRVATRFAEVPIVLRYDRKTRPSKMRAGATIRDHLRLWLSSRREPSGTNRLPDGRQR